MTPPHAETPITHPAHPGWPEVTETVALAESHRFPHGAYLRLRPLVRADGAAWRAQRLRDEKILRPVEPTSPTSWEQSHNEAGWLSHFHFVAGAARDGLVIPLAIELNGRFAGQLTLGNIQHGSVRDCWIGYWVSSAVTGAGVATAACALGVDHAMRRVGLHRVTATYLPENPASGKVLARCGFREEGYFRRNLHIDGSWRDHYFVAVTREDYSTSAVDRLCASGRIAGILRH
ncbi:MAG: GNAT family protein [Corynebacterium sp.]|nr:GNAT family protein [Corynebacterium sp.]